MSGSPTKNQHFVPRFYLERFTDPDGFVWVYDATRNEIFSGKPEEIGFEKYFYSPKQKDGSRPTVIEDFLADIESSAAPLFPIFEKGTDPKGEEREILSLFLAAQYLRSPMMLGVGAEVMGQMVGHLGRFNASHEDFHERSMDRWDESTGEVTDPEEREKMREFLRDPKNYQVEVLQNAGLGMLAGIPKVAAIFFDMKWFVCESSAQHLVTCDSPVVLNRDPNSQHPFYGDGGLLGRTNFVTYPVSPTLMLELCWEGNPLGYIPTVPKDRGRLYNRQRANGANRFLYSFRKDTGIAKLGAKIMGSERRNRLRSSADLPKVAVKRKLR